MLVMSDVQTRPYRTFFLHLRRPLDTEASDDQMDSSAPLLSNVFINTTANQDDVKLTTFVPNRRSVSVSRMPISDDATAALAFHEINYSIGNKMKLNKRRVKKISLPFFKSETHKQILSNVSGRFTNGMNAILGEIYHTSVLAN